MIVSDLRPFCGGLDVGDPPEGIAGVLAAVLAIAGINAPFQTLSVGKAPAHHAGEISGVHGPHEGEIDEMFPHHEDTGHGPLFQKAPSEEVTSTEMISDPPPSGPTVILFGGINPKPFQNIH